MKEIKDFPGYFISKHGGIFSAKSHSFIKPWLHRKLYYRIGLFDGEKQRKKFIHVLVATAYIPNPLNLPEVNHLDGNKLNNYYKNLVWCTRKDNVLHAYRVLGHSSPNKGKKKI